MGRDVDREMGWEVPGRSFEGGRCCRLAARHDGLFRTMLYRPETTIHVARYGGGFFVYGSYSGECKLALLYISASDAQKDASRGKGGLEF